MDLFFLHLNTIDVVLMRQFYQSIKVGVGRMHFSGDET